MASLGDWLLTFAVYDGENHSADMAFCMDGAMTPGQLQTWAGLAQPILENVTDGDVRQASISRVLDVYTAGSATASSDVEIGARAILRAEDTLKTARITIPAFRRQYILPNDDKVDLTQANVIAFVDMLTDGLTVSGAPTNGGRPRDSENRLITGIVSFTESYGKKRK